jgi:KaiC/GvpD/RAD55 family RecA-like ATPase
MPVHLSREDLETRKIFLVLSSAGKIRERNIEIIREISAQGFKSVVITTNYPYKILKKLYEQNGVDLSQVFFIDAITGSSTVPEKDPMVKYVNSPANLTDMGIAVTEMLKDISGQKVCILFDSVSTMMIYLPSANISKFIHFVTNKLRLTDISGIFMAVEKGLDPQLLSQLTTFVDEIMDVSGE